MGRMTLAISALLLAVVVAETSAQGANPSELYTRAKRAIDAGNVVPERDLAPLVNVLRTSTSDDDLRTAIDKIETLADANGPSPAAV